MSKEATPPTSTAATATGIVSDKSAPTLTEKDTKLMLAVLLSFKSGIPDVEYVRLQKNGGFNTIKTAQNTWGVLKKKLKDIHPEAFEAVDGAEPKTPSKPKATPKKRKTSSDEDAVADGEEGIAKKPKTPRKKKEVTADGEDCAGASPQKKPRKTPAKKGKKSEEAVVDGDVIDVKGEVKDTAEAEKTADISEKTVDGSEKSTATASADAKEEAAGGKE